MQKWFNSRLFAEQGQVQFDHTGPFVLCHLDIAPRNIIWCDDGCICLLDWASAGFYPRLLEYVSLHLQKDQKLLNALGFITENEEEQQKKICRALYNIERYSL